VNQDTGTTATVSPQQRAKADAAWIVASFAPPPGWTRLSHAPSGVHGALSHQPVTMSDDPGADVVDDSSLWQVLGPPSGVFSYERAHLPARFQSQGRGVGYLGGPGFQLTYVDFTVQSGLGPGETAALLVGAIVSTSGQTYVRADAQVTWLPSRPAATFLPAARIHAVVATVVPDPNDTRKPPPPVTITDPVKVGQLVSLVNGLLMDPPGPAECGAASGWGLQMEFLAAVGGPRLATAFADSADCGGVVLLMGAGRLVSRLWASGGEVGLGRYNVRLAEQAAAICGINWGP
jgi:hypothetical protein